LNFCKLADEKIVNLLEGYHSFRPKSRAVLQKMLKSKFHVEIETLRITKQIANHFLCL